MGIQSFDWGLGILSNSGTKATRFGVNQQGNTYTRLAVSRTFDALNWFVAGDTIIRDENALWSAGDRAYQTITGLQYVQEGLRVGALSGFRYQQIERRMLLLWFNVQLGCPCRYICHSSTFG